MPIALLLALAAAPQDDAALDWIRERHVPLATLERDAELDDLARVKDAIGDARVVLLGEPTHGEGRAFAAKIRLVRFLHEECGFDVLVFESGLFGCREAWRAFRRGGTPPRVAASEGIFPIWTRSREMLPLWDYLADRADADRPLELCGYDCQVTGNATRRLGEAIEEVAARVGFEGDDLEAVLGVVTPLANHDTPLGWDERGRRVARAFDRFEAALARAARRARGDERADLEFWARTAASLAAQTENLATQGERQGGRLAESFNPRDAQGGENLVWLAEERYAGRKLIVWCATMHAVRHHPRIEPVGSGLDYAGVESAGHHLAEELGEDVYVIACVAAEGRGGLPWGDPGPPLPPPVEGSFEDLCLRAGLEDAFVDLRALPRRHPLRGRTVARPLGNAPMRAPWPEVLDAFVFLEERAPSTDADGPAPSDDVGDPFALVPALEEELDTIRGGERGGNVWATKWNLVDAVERWLRASRPDADALAAAEEDVLALLDRAADHPSLAWRIHEAAALLAAAAGAGERALAHHERSLASHPENDVPDPTKHSGLQHLVNRIVERKGADDDAFDWALDLVREDPRMRYFYLDPWRDSLDAARLRALVRDLVRAYEERARRFPDEREAIEGYVRRLGGG